MIIIGICDDEQYIIDSLRDKINQYVEEQQWEVAFVELHSGQELIAQEEALDLLFLDIEMPEMDGIEAGKIFRRKQPDCKIAMVTSMEGRMREAFSLEAFRFITKPFEEQELFESLGAFGESRLGYQPIILYERRKAVSILQKDIHYIQAYDSYTEYIVGNRLLRSEKSLSALEKELDEKLFVRIHNKYIINLYYVRDYSKGEVIVGDKKFKIAKRRKVEFEEKFREYDLKYR